MLNGLDLFSGIGGISLALKEWVRPLAYCEKDTYCQAVLLSRMADRRLGLAPIWDDIQTLDGIQFIKRGIDIIYGGFPCQDISIAGNGKGLAGERSGLFFEIVRLCRKIEPRFIFLENVPAITSRGGVEVVRQFTEMGYDCRWCVISASSVGALHKRERWFLLAHSNIQGSQRQWRQQRSPVAEKPQSSGNGKDDPKLQFWEVESDVGRLANGVQHRMDKLRALGNSVVPAQAKEAFKILMGIKDTKE